MNPVWLARWVALPVGVLAVSTSGILIRLTTANPLVTATHRVRFHVDRSDRNAKPCASGLSSPGSA